MGKGVGKSIARSSALGWLGGLLASGLARRRQKTKRQGRVWPTLVQLVQRFPVPGPRRPSREAKQEGGGPGLVQHSIAEREGPAFNPTTLPANPVPFFAGSWDACELQRPKHQLHLTKTPAAVIKLSPPRQVLFVKGGVISSPSLVFSIASIPGRGKITKDKATPLRRGDLHRKWVPTMQQHVDSSTWRFVKRTYAPAICTLPLLIPTGRQVSENTKRRLAGSRGTQQSCQSSAA